MKKNRERPAARAETICAAARAENSAREDRVVDRLRRAADLLEIELRGVDALPHWPRRGARSQAYRRDVRQSQRLAPSDRSRLRPCA